MPGSNLLAPTLAVALTAASCLTSCGHDQQAHAAATTAATREPAPPARDPLAVLLEHEPYRAMERDREFHEAFHSYFRWLAGLEVPDAIYILGFMEQNTRRLDALSMIFHEKVELAAWLELGHRLEDVMTLEYNQEHYPEVYPTAHSRAMRAELELIEAFAHEQGMATAPALAYVLVAPMAEERGVEVALMARRLRHNPEYQDATVSRQHLDNATQVYERGGYRYQDRQRLIDEALRFVQSRATGPVTPR